MLYTTAICLYALGVSIASLFNKKARLMIKGHRKIYGILKESINPNDSYVWFHAASLGEFEQGRPLMERLRKQHPEYKILLTFFSPSGYEVRKNWEGADVVCYLPFDIPLSVNRFLNLARPKMAFFIKYEFWMNFLKELHRRDIPAYSVSSIFRPDQVFFRSYGKPYVRALHCFTHFFVQNETSKKLLHTLGITNVTVVGDTRFDRVIDIYEAAKESPETEKFSRDAQVMVVGSSWEPDEEIIIPYFNAHPELKLIIAPHVVNEEHLAFIERKMERPGIRLSQIKDGEVGNADYLIIDCYGLLSGLYRYGSLAYVGGGFGVGVHNVPEAAVYNVPIIIGPNNKRFREVQALLKCGGCHEIHNESDFVQVMDFFLKNPALRTEAGQKAGQHIRNNAGAADKIFNAIPW